MKKQKVIKHISRIDQESKNQHGWWVRIHRNKQMIQKFFSDVAWGGKNKALINAEKYRDELLSKYPKSEHGNLFNKSNARNRSGIVGVHRTRTRKHGRSYEVWQASWMLPNGKLVNRKFHFSPNGRSEEEAKRLAIRARKEGIKLIRELLAAKKDKATD